MLPTLGVLMVQERSWPLLCSKVVAFCGARYVSSQGLDCVYGAGVIVSLHFWLFLTAITPLWQPLDCIPPHLCVLSSKVIRL